MEVVLAVAGLVIASVSAVLAWLQWQRPRPVRATTLARVGGERPVGRVSEAPGRGGHGDGLPPALVTRLIGPFVGRRLELDTIEKEWSAVSAGGSGVVLISGDPGVGKSELVHEFARSLGSSAFVVASRPSLSGTRAHAVVADLVRQIILLGGHQVAPGATDDLGTRALRRLLPDVLGSGDGSRAEGAGTANPAGELVALHDAIGGLLGLAASERPIVAVIEDLHAATSDSARAVAALVEQRIPGVLFVLTHRLREPESPAVGGLADVARTTGSFRSLRLRELAEEDLVQLVDGLLPGHDGLEVGAELYRRTGGHPFFATSILESIARAGAAMSGEPLSRSHVPDDIAEHIARRLTRLTPDARHALEAASVIGDEFELDLLARVLKRPLDDSLVELVVEVADSGLFVDVSGRPGWLRFSHELIRDAVYLRPTALWRARLHRAVVHALGSSPDLVAVRAHHCYEAAGIYVELRTPSVDASIAAARDGIERMAYGDAVCHYGRALDLAESDERSALVGAGLGDALWRQGDLVEARHQLERAAALARELGSVELLAEIATTMSAVAFQCGASDARLRDLYEEVLALLPEEEVFWRVRLVTAVIREVAPWQVSPGLRRRAAGVLRQATNDDDPATRAYAHLIRHDGQLGDLDSRRRARTAAQVITAADAAGDPHLLCEGYWFALFAALEQGDLDGAHDAIAGCERTADRFRSPLARWQAALYRAGLAISQRPLAEARAAIDDAREIGAALAYSEVERMHSMQLALLRRELGRVSRIEEDIGPRGAETYDLPVWKAAMAVGLCETRGGRHPERAVPVLERLVGEGIDRVPPDRSYPMVLAYLAEAFAYLRDRDGAGVVLPLAQAVHRHAVVSRAAVYCGSMDHHLGLLHATLGQYEEAIACFESASTIEARMAAPLWTCHTLVAHAQTLRARDDPGDREAADPLETKARIIAGRFGYIRARHQLDGKVPPQVAAPDRAATRS